MATNGRIAIVTGAGSGIGRAASLALQSAGYSVVLDVCRIAELEELAPQPIAEVASVAAVGQMGPEVSPADQASRHAYHSPLRRRTSARRTSIQHPKSNIQY